MTSIIRAVAVALLCGMIAMGHAPAWLHVAGCDHEEGHLNHPAVNPSLADSAACPHSCCHSADADDNNAGAEPHSLPPAGEREHDSDTCTICQSLVAPTGVHWQLESPAFGDVCVCDARITDVSPPASTLFSNSLPRGPPTLVA